jgi:E3 Ubiquitin ligase
MFFSVAIAFYYGRSDGWVWAVVGAGAGVYLFVRGFRLLQRKRLIMDTPSSKIRSASLGLVELSGLAVGPYTLPAPITGVPCYFYRTLAWQWKQNGKSSSWVKAAEESMHVPFYLDDNTGRVLVDPQGAEMDIHRDFHEEFSNSVFSSSLEIPANISSFLGRHGVGTDKKIKIEEYCIKIKNFLFVLGTLAENPGLTASPTPVRTLSADQSAVSIHIPSGIGSLSISSDLTLSARKADMPEEVIQLSPGKGPAKAMDLTQQGKLAAAMMKAGIINPAAWAVAGLQYGATANLGDSGGATGAATAEEFELTPKTVLMKGDHNPAFFISWQSQRDVVKSLSWKSALMIWGGPTLTLFCVYLLAARFGWL